MSPKKQNIVRRTTYLIIVFSALLVGLFISQYTMPLSTSWLLLIGLSIPFIRRSVSVTVVILVLAGVLLGWWRGGLLQAQHAKYYALYDQKVTITARATEDSFYADKSQLEFAAEDIMVNGDVLPGKVRVRGFGEAMVYRHDIVQVTGKLYPARGGKQASISFADIEVIARAQSSLEDFRRNFIAGMETALPEPAASFGVGLLVGQRSLLPDYITEVLVAVGLTHIVAVSGYNLTIISNATKKGLRKFSRFRTLAISLGLIYLFILITGFSPSIVRAAIVSGLGLTAWYFGRSFRPLLLILFTAAITGFYNPYYVWSDIGWYLSFLAFFGVLILAPLIAIRLFGAKKPGLISGVAIESFAAQIMTMPLIIWIFGRVAVVGFLANIIVVPMVPFAMLFSLIAGIAGMLVPVISGWFAIPARILLDVMLLIATWFSKWPGAQIRISTGAVGLVLLYAIILILLLGLKKYSVSVIIKQKLYKSNEE